MYKRGFTLIELTITMAILAIMSGFIFGNFFNSFRKGRDAQRKSDLAQVKNALELFYEDKGAYPTFSLSWGSKLCETQSAASCGTEKVYMQKLPKDPTTTASYSYSTDATGTYYRLYSCLENTEQIINTVSVNNGSFSCSYNCKDSAGTSIACIWGVSSSNTLP